MCIITGVFAALHGPPMEDSGHGSGGCAGVQWRGVENALAAEWALNAINNQTSPGHNIGREYNLT